MSIVAGTKSLCKIIIIKKKEGKFLEIHEKDIKDIKEIRQYAENYLKKHSHKYSDNAHICCVSTYNDEPEIKRLINIIDTVNWEKISE